MNWTIDVLCDVTLYNYIILGFSTAAQFQVNLSFNGWDSFEWEKLHSPSYMYVLYMQLWSISTILFAVQLSMYFRFDIGSLSLILHQQYLATFFGPIISKPNWPDKPHFEFSPREIFICHWNGCNVYTDLFGFKLFDQICSASHRLSTKWVFAGLWRAINIFAASAFPCIVLIYPSHHINIHVSVLDNVVDAIVKLKTSISKFVDWN